MSPLLLLSPYREMLWRRSRLRLGRCRDKCEEELPAEGHGQQVAAESGEKVNTNCWGNTGDLPDELEGWPIGTADHGAMFLGRPQQPEGMAMGQERHERAKRKTAGGPHPYFSDEVTGALQGAVTCSALVYSSLQLGFGFCLMGIFWCYSPAQASEQGWVVIESSHKGPAL